MRWLRSLRFEDACDTLSAAGPCAEVGDRQRFRPKQLSGFHHPAVGDGLARRQAGQDPRVIEISWRAQRRLHQRGTVFSGQRRKPAGVVAIACARELAAFCWEAATLN